VSLFHWVRQFQVGDSTDLRLLDDVTGLVLVVHFVGVVFRFVVVAVPAAAGVATGVAVARRPPRFIATWSNRSIISLSVVLILNYIIITFFPKETIIPLLLKSTYVRCAWWPAFRRRTRPTIDRWTAYDRRPLRPPHLCAVCPAFDAIETNVTVSNIPLKTTKKGEALKASRGNQSRSSIRVPRDGRRAGPIKVVDERPTKWTPHRTKSNLT